MVHLSHSRRLQNRLACNYSRLPRPTQDWIFFRAIRVNDYMKILTRKFQECTCL